MTYLMRLGGLLLFFIAGAALERWLKGPEAQRWKEYSFVVLCGLIGAAFAMINDQITVTLSPDYFIYGKGLDADQGLRMQALALGFKAGFFAGLVLGMVLLMLRPAKFERQPFALWPWTLWPMALALLFALPVALVFKASPLSSKTLKDLLPLVGKDRAQDFVFVQGLHFGLYLGALLGVIGAVVQLRRSTASGTPAGLLGTPAGLSGTPAGLSGAPAGLSRAPGDEEHERHDHAEAGPDVAE